MTDPCLAGLTFVLRTFQHFHELFRVAINLGPPDYSDVRQQDLLTDFQEVPGRTSGMIQRVAQIAWPKANRIPAHLDLTNTLTTAILSFSAHSLFMLMERPEVESLTSDQKAGCEMRKIAGPYTVRIAIWAGQGHAAFSGACNQPSTTFE